MPARAVIGLASMLLVLLAPAAAAADEVPVYDGTMIFPEIKGPSDPDEFTWQVTLDEGQVLKKIDDQNAEVFYAEGHPAFSIVAVAAHDADGSAVATTLDITQPDLITLVVHHRAGNPETGQPFDYPITGGVGWDGGFVPEIVKGPKDETELREEREKLEREERERALAPAPTVPGCQVPALKGLTLRAAKRSLQRSDCAIGPVRRRRGATGRTARVVKQGSRAGTQLVAGSPVAVTLAS